MNRMVFYGYHGVYPEENKLGQRFFIDLTIETNFSKASQSDDINDTIDYGLVYESVKAVMEGRPRKLIEKLAEEIAQKLFKQFSLIENVTIKLTKPDPPIPGHYDSVAIEITRKRPQS